MLVLSRRKDETIMIGDEVEITIVDVRGDTVRLGIKAPRSVSVHRKEIYDAIQAENIAAAKESIPDESAVGGLGNLLKSGAEMRPSALEKLSGGKGCPAPAAAPSGGLDKLTGKLGKLSGGKGSGGTQVKPPSGLDKLLPKAKPPEK